MPSWCEFTDGTKATINGDKVDDVAAQHGKTIKQRWSLPYPATPELNPGDCPAFCYTPEHCKGRGSCPQGYACSE